MDNGLCYMIQIDGRLLKDRTICLGCTGTILQYGFGQIGGSVADVDLTAGDIVLASIQGHRFGKTGDGMFGGGIGC